MKLNKKGMTSVEVLVTFVIVVIIMASLFNTIMKYKDKQLLESYKTTINSYINSIERDIQGDIVTRKVKNIQIINNSEELKELVFEFHEGPNKTLKIENVHAGRLNEVGNIINSDVTKDKYIISYTDSSSQLIKYPFPNLGKEEKKINETTYTYQDLSISNIDMIIPPNSNQAFSLTISLTHNSLDDKYHISIFAPIFNES